MYVGLYVSVYIRTYVCMHVCKYAQNMYVVCKYNTKCMSCTLYIGDNYLKKNITQCAMQYAGLQ